MEILLNHLRKSSQNEHSLFLWQPIIYVITQKSILNISQTEAGNVFQNKELFTDGWQWSVFLDTYFNIYKNKLFQNIESNNLTHKSIMFKEFRTISQQA